MRLGMTAVAPCLRARRSLITSTISSATAVQNAQDCSVHSPHARSRVKTPSTMLIVPRNCKPAMMVKMPWTPTMIAMMVMPRGRDFCGNVYMGCSSIPVLLIVIPEERTCYYLSRVIINLSDKSVITRPLYHTLCFVILTTEELSGPCTSQHGGRVEETTRGTPTRVPTTHPRPYRWARSLTL